MNVKMNTYAILMETNEVEGESWYYFLKVQENEKALQYLNEQLNKIDIIFEDDLNTFILEIENPVSEQTAKEMCKVDLNSVSYHRKFDGKLQMINLNLKKKDSNHKMLLKLNKSLKDGKISDAIDQEDEVVSDNLEESSSDEESDPEQLLVLPPIQSKNNVN